MTRPDWDAPEPLPDDVDRCLNCGQPADDGNADCEMHQPYDPSDQ